MKGHKSTPPQRAGRQEFTGRYLVLGRQSQGDALPRLLRDTAGLRIASASDFPRGAIEPASVGDADGIYLDLLGIAITSTAPDQIEALTRGAGTGEVVTVEPERVVFPFSAPRPDAAPSARPAITGQFGPRSVDTLVCSLLSSFAASPAAGAPLVDESMWTWGLVSTRVIGSSRTGRGVRVAVLDTGFDIQHPDFAGRGVTARSFIDGESAQDGHSHGTHCIGTSCGPAYPRTLPRYGVASEAEVFAGKVLANGGRGNDGAILAAINWAITNGCRIISMSLGSAATIGQPYSQVFETAAQRALAANSLIIAAAGNESDRNNGIINPVGHPANCPSIMAVGAVDVDMQIAYFSTRGMNADGGGVDIAGPGVDVYSTVPPGTYGVKSGTSMACPHVAGIAALYCEANPHASAREIWQLLTRNAKPLNLEPSDVGAGLAQAPA